MTLWMGSPWEGVQSVMWQEEGGGCRSPPGGHQQLKGGAGREKPTKAVGGDLR